MENKKLKWWHHAILAIIVVTAYVAACVLLVLLLIPIAIDEVLQMIRKTKGSKTNVE